MRSDIFKKVTEDWGRVSPTYALLESLFEGLKLDDLDSVTLATVQQLCNVARSVAQASSRHSYDCSGTWGGVFNFDHGSCSIGALRPFAAYGMGHMVFPQW